MNTYDATLNVKNGFPVFSTLVEANHIQVPPFSCIIRRHTFPAPTAQIDWQATRMLPHGVALPYKQMQPMAF